MVPDDRIDEFAGEGGRVAPVVAVMGPLPGQGIDGQQAVVGSYQQMQGGFVGEEMDVFESVSGLDRGKDGPGIGFKPVDAEVPGPQPQVALLVHVHRADARGPAVPEDQVRCGKGPGCGIVEREPLLRRLVGDPQAAVPVDQQSLHLVPVQKLGEGSVGIPEDAFAPDADPEGAVPVFGETGDQRIRNLGNTFRKMGHIIPEHGVFRPDPKLAGRVLVKLADIVVLPGRESVVDELLPVEAVQAAGRTHPDEPGAVLDEGLDGVGRKSVPGCNVTEGIPGGFRRTDTDVCE